MRPRLSSQNKTIYRLIGALILFLAVMSLFGYITREVIEGETLQRDQQILLSINAISDSFLNRLVLGTTTLGGVAVVTLVSVTLALLFAKYKKWSALLLIAFSMLGSIILNIILKLIFARPRPELWPRLVSESTYSFPSGHALLTSTLALSLVLIMWNTKWRWSVVAGAIIYTVVIGFTRLYLGVHYPTDIIAGWCVGTAWTIIVASLIGIVRWRRGITVSSGISDETRR